MVALQYWFSTKNIFKTVNHCHNGIFSVIKLPESLQKANKIGLHDQSLIF